MEGRSFGRRSPQAARSATPEHGGAGALWTTGRASRRVDRSRVKVSAAMTDTQQPDFADRVALVTGATRGIGFGIAEELVPRGGRVCITARKPDELEEAVRALDPDGKGLAVAARGSADDADHQKATVEQVMETFGRLDCLVNNAAVN